MKDNFAALFAGPYPRVCTARHTRQLLRYRIHADLWPLQYWPLTSAMLTFGLPCWPLAYHVGLWPTMLTFGLYNIDLWPLPCWPLAYHVDFFPTMVSLGLPCRSLTYRVDLLPTMVTFSLPCWPLVGYVLTFGLYNFDLWPLPVPCWPLAYHADLWLTMLIFGLPCWPLAYHVDLWPSILYVDHWTPDNRLTIVFLYKILQFDCDLSLF